LIDIVVALIEVGVAELRTMASIGILVHTSSDPVLPGLLGLGETVRQTYALHGVVAQA